MDNPQSSFAQPGRVGDPSLHGPWRCMNPGAGFGYDFCRALLDRTSGTLAPTFSDLMSFRLHPAVLITPVMLAFGSCFVSSAAIAGCSHPQRVAVPRPTSEKGYDALKQDQYDVAISEFRAALRSTQR